MMNAKQHWNPNIRKQISAVYVIIKLNLLLGLEMKEQTPKTTQVEHHSFHYVFN